MAKKEVERGDNSFGIASVVFGVLSIIFALSFGGIVLGVVGFFFSLRAKRTANNRWAKWGFWLNIVGIVLGVIVIYFFVTYLPNYVSQAQGISG